MIICWQLHPGDHTPAPHHCYGHRLNLHGTGWAGLGWAGLDKESEMCGSEWEGVEDGVLG